MILTILQNGLYPGFKTFNFAKIKWKQLSNKCAEVQKNSPMELYSEIAKAGWKGQPTQTEFVFQEFTQLGTMNK